MTANEYLQRLIDNKANSNTYTQNESQAKLQIHQWINEWRQNFNTGSYWSSISVDVQLSGSRAKGTSLKGKSDMDLFVSITDTNNERTPKEYYDSLYNFLKPKLKNDMRKQNVSLGLDYAGCDIDITPAKKLNSQSYSRNMWEKFNDHYLWQNKKQKRFKTNIQKHIDLVQQYGRQKEIMLIKMWRNCHNLELPSIYIEILASEVLGKRDYNSDLWQDTRKLLIALRDTIYTRAIIDPSNSENCISDSIDDGEKEMISKSARNTLSETYLEQMIW